MAPQTRTSSSPAKPSHAPSTPSTHANEENIATPANLGGLPDSQSTVPTDASPHTDDFHPPHQPPGQTPTVAPPPITRSKPPRVSLSRTESAHFQAGLTTLSDGQSSADKKINETALACARNRIDDRKATAASLAELNATLSKLIHDEFQSVKQDLSSLREDTTSLTERVTAAHNGLQAHGGRLGHHDNDLKDLMTECRGVSEGIERLEDDVLKRLSECRSQIRSLQTDLRALKSDVSTHYKTRSVTQDKLDDVLNRLSTIEEDILPAIIDQDATLRRPGGLKTKSVKGKQRATASDLDSSDASESSSPYHEEADDSGSAGWHGVLKDSMPTASRQPSIGEPGPSKSNKRQRVLTPENPTEHRKKPRATVSPSLNAGLPHLRNTPSKFPADTAPSPLTPAESASLAFLPSSIPGRQPAPNPPISSSITLDGPPDLSPNDAFERGVVRITMKNLEATDFFHPTDKMHNYNLFRQVNGFLGANCFPVLTPEPDGNTPISTTETSFVYTRPADVRSVLTAWRLRPEYLSNLRIYEDSAAPTGHNTQHSSQAAALQQILATDAQTSSRGRGHQSGRGHPAGRGRPLGRGHPSGRGYGLDRQPSRGSLRGPGGGSHFYDPAQYY